jgi:small subunit ribosomal protein S9
MPTKAKSKSAPKAKKQEEVIIVAPVVPEEIAAEETDIDMVPDTLEELPEGAKEKYYEAVGRRKRAVARVRLMTRKAGDPLTEDAGLMTVNGKDFTVYFLDKNLVQRIEQPLRLLKSLHRFKVTAKVVGGGISGQADAVRHGISRTLELFDANFRKKLKKAGFLTRDPRKVERKKPGLKKARKSGRWAKR